MKTRYDIFEKNENEAWENKLVWGGLYGNAPKVSISISRFNKETHLLSEFKGVDCVDDFYKKAKSLAKKYIKWVKDYDNIYNDIEYHDMENFFIGGMGEFFFTCLLNEGRLLIEKNGRIKVYDFDYVAPLLPGEKDFGIDLTGVVDGRNCVMQVKFWNPFSDEILTTDILQKAYAEGVLNEHINPTEKENVVICWLGNEEKISVHLRDNKKLQEHIIFVDKKALSLSADKKNPVFWENLTSKLSTLGME